MQQVTSEANILMAPTEKDKKNLINMFKCIAGRSAELYVSMTDPY